MRPTVVLAKDSLGPHLADLPRQLRRAGFDVWLAPHLYHLPEDSDFWGQLAGLEGAVVLLQPLYPRAIEALSRRHGAWREGWAASDLRSCESSEGQVEKLQSTASIIEGTDSEPGFLDSQSHRLPRARLIVDDQNGGGFRHH